MADACEGPGLEHLCDRLAVHPALEIARERALAFVAAARRAVEEGPCDGADLAEILGDVAELEIEIARGRRRHALTAFQ